MMKQNIEKIFRAAIYVRLSKEDGDSFSFGKNKNESDSITNQKMQLQSFAKRQPDIQVVATFEDDGFTGTSFNRPGWQQVVEAMKSKEIDCLIVKDFSRLGREYLEAGNYIEKVFPQMGIRFISVNDDYDSLHPKGQSDSLLVPIKNLLNEQYSRDTSGKIRSALKVKRQSGQLVSNFAVFGYCKDPEDKNHLVVDEYAAGIVQNIYKMKLDGMSMYAIATKLNVEQVPSPADYKKNCGIRYKTSFKVTTYSKWSANSIKRILTNEVYCGHMIQGKRMKKSYKLKVIEQVAEENWDRIENTHEAIISKHLFDEVQRVLQMDTRVTPDNETIYPLSGLLYCGDCGAAMTHKIVPYNGKKYAYYVCNDNKMNRNWCSSHSFAAKKLEASVLATLQAHIKLVLDMKKAMDGIGSLAWEQREVKKITSQIAALEKEIDQNKQLRVATYEDLKQGVIEREEFDDLRNGFSERIAEAETALKKLKGQQNAIVEGLNDQQGFLTRFKEFENVQELNRNMVISMVERIDIHLDNIVDVKMRYADQFASIVEFVEQVNRKKVIKLNKEVANGTSI